MGPWVGAQIGVLLLSGANTKFAALDTTLDAGIDVRPTSAFALGPYDAVTYVLTEPYVRDPDGKGTGLAGAAFGVRGAERF